VALGFSGARLATKSTTGGPVLWRIRLNANGTNLLSTKAMFCDEPGFEVASVLVMGKTEAVLIDAQWTLSNAHRLSPRYSTRARSFRRSTSPTRTQITTLERGTIAEAFPQARVVAVPSEAEIMNSQFFGKMEIWEGVIGSP